MSSLVSLKNQAKLYSSLAVLIMNLLRMPVESCI